MQKNSENKTNELEKRLEEGVKTILTSESFRNYLTTMQKFSRYSFRNTVLIFCQMPKATHVAGYAAWEQKFKRHVRKGEKAIRIFAPCIRREKDVEKPEDTGEKAKETDTAPAPVYFRVASVFDVSQTDGQPLPEAPDPVRLEGTYPETEAVLQALETLSPVPVQYLPPEKMEGEANGWYFRNDHIDVRDGMSDTQTVKTLIHEVAHAMTVPKETDPRDKSEREIEAESVAYMVCDHLGIDTAEYSFPYIAGWGETKKMEEIRKVMESVRGVANTIMDHIDDALIQYREEREATREPAAENTYSIYQIPDGSPLKHLRFAELKTLLANNGMQPPRIDAYRKVYDGFSEKPVELEKLYMQFQGPKPSGYTGWSLSVSDVIVVRAHDKETAYYCDNFGFAEIPGFLEKEPAQNKPTPEAAKPQPAEKETDAEKPERDDGEER